MPTIQGSLVNGVFKLDTTEAADLRAADTADNANTLANVKPAAILTAIDGMAIPAGAKTLLKMIVRRAVALELRVASLEARLAKLENKG